MAYKKKHHHHHRYRRHNPFGVSGGDVKDALFVALGAGGSVALPQLVAPTFNVGWQGVISTALSGVVLSAGAKMMGAHGVAPELLKGGLAAATLKALNMAGVKIGGLGLYAPSWFGIPTASSQYLQAASGNMPGFNRGGGTILFPGPQAAMPVPVKSNLGYHRFRSRYAGGYGG